MWIQRDGARVVWRQDWYGLLRGRAGKNGRMRGKGTALGKERGKDRFRSGLFIFTPEHCLLPGVGVGCRFVMLREWLIFLPRRDICVVPTRQGHTGSSKRDP